MIIKRKSTIHAAIAFALLILLLCLFGLLFTSLFSQKIDMQLRYETAQLQLNKYTVLATSLPQLKTTQQQLLAAQKNDTRYLIAGNASLAAAKLQKKIQLLIQHSTARLISLQVVKTQAKDDFQPITLKFQIHISNAKLLNLLYQLENSKPSGFIDKLQIQQQRNYQTSDEMLLDVRMEYTAFMVVHDEQ